MKKGQIKTIIEHSESKKLFVSESLYKNINEGAAKLVDQVILTDNFAVVPNGTPVEELKNLKANLPEPKEDFAQAEVEEEEAVVV